MSNTLTVAPAKPIKQKPIVTKTRFGTLRTMDLENGRHFREFTTDFEYLGRPFFTIASGVDPETNRMAVADGFIAVGQRARGFVAIGQFANGYLSLGQFATGRIAAIGQFTVAPFAIGQFALGIAVVGQMGAAGWGVFQAGAVLFGGVAQSLINLSNFL